MLSIWTSMQFCRLVKNLSNFSFSNSVFYPFGDFSAIFVKLKIVACKLFQFWKSVKFVVLERVKGPFYLMVQPFLGKNRTTLCKMLLSITHYIDLYIQNYHSSMVR